MTWKLRRTGVDIKPASWFEANERNIRTHPKSQGDSFKSVAKAVGWAAAVSVNLRSSPDWGRLQGQPIVINGHMRIIEALKVGDDTPVPVDYYDFTPDEEKLVLLTLDYIGELAGVDRVALSSLMEDVKSKIDTLEKDEHLDSLLETMARQNAIYLDKFSENLPNIDDVVAEQEKRRSSKARLIVVCDPARVEEIGNFLNSITGCEWTRKE